MLKTEQETQSGDGVAISTVVNTHTVNTAQWNSMNFSQLIEQKNLMYSRYDYLFQNGNANAAQSIMNGIMQLDSLIQSRMLK